MPEEKEIFFDIVEPLMEAEENYDKDIFDYFRRIMK
jgi:hypothetical protein